MFLKEAGSASASKLASKEWNLIFYDLFDSTGNIDGAKCYLGDA